MAKRRRKPKAAGPPSPRATGGDRGKQRRRTSKVFRSQTPPLVLALLACVVLTVLIATGLGIRFLILRATTGPNPEFGTADRVTEPDNLPPGDAEAVPLSDLTDASLPALPDESVLKVLPPPAAKKGGRQLPGVLYVGDNLDMFGQLHDALLATIPGDIIEIRTDRILNVAPVTIPEFAESATAPVMIRAAGGYYPVLRQTVSEPVIRVNNRAIWLQGLHFTGQQKWFYGNGLSITADRCSWTRSQVTGGDKAGALNGVIVDRCVFRNSHFGDQCGGHVGMYRSFFVGDGQSKVWLNGSNDRLEVRHCTFVQSGLASVALQAEVKHRVRIQISDTVFNALSCCPRLLLLSVPRAVDNVAAIDARTVFEQSVSEFTLRNNFLHFHRVNGDGEGWGAVANYASGQAVAFKASDFPDVQSQLQWTHGNTQVAKMGDLLWSQDPERSEKLNSVVRQLTWQDAALTFSKDARVDARLKRREVGCIPELLPAIPPEAGDLYDLTPAAPP